MKAKCPDERTVAEACDASFISISKIENHWPDFGDFPSKAVIEKFAAALEADEGELLILAKRTPEPVKKRVLQRPDAFLAFAACDDATLDKLMVKIGQTPKRR